MRVDGEGKTAAIPFLLLENGEGKLHLQHEDASDFPHDPRRGAIQFPFLAVYTRRQRGDAFIGDFQGGDRHRKECQRKNSNVRPHASPLTRGQDSETSRPPLIEQTNIKPKK